MLLSLLTLPPNNLSYNKSPSPNPTHRVNMHRFTPLLLLVLLLPKQAAAEKITYEKHVRPILKAHCFQCHGEEGAKKGNLDLRLRRFIVRGGDSGSALALGNPKDSLLLQRIANGEMPPGKKKVSPAEQAIIAKWIRLGARTSRPEPKSLKHGYVTDEERSFWAFQPIKRPRLPNVAGAKELSSPIDHFIVRRLQQAKLRRSPLASKTVLIRRLYYDLVGVPPTPSELDQFLRDKSPLAYDRLLDRLLSSPKYGERWGRHWLDVAGYADSEGFVDRDPVRDSAYHFRDYVIRAFNAGIPFDQFIREQLAGDELVPQPYKNLSSEQMRLLTATGFLRMAPDGTATGGVDRNVASNEMIADTIRITSTALLGLTVGCARCHNHRYDPISQRDYYRIRAIFEPAMDWKKWRTPSARKISLYSAEQRATAAKIEAKAQKAAAARSKIQAGHIQRALYEELIKAPDHLKATLKKAYLTPGSKRTKAQTALLKEYPNIRNISGGSLYLYAEQRRRRANEIAAVAKKKEQLFIAAVRKRELAKVAAESKKQVEAALALPASQRTTQQKGLLKRYPGVLVDAKTLAKFDPKGAALVAEYRRAADVCRKTDHKKQLADLAKGIQAIRNTKPTELFVRALTEPVNHTPKTVLFRRGDHRQPADTLSPAPLKILANRPTSIASNNKQLKTTGRRTEYARYLTNGKHPLLARVIVNRVWLHHFGRGIVNTPGDFGQLGDRPTHPQLLDWLADEFMASGWQLKRLHKLMLSSYTYRQVSTRTQQLDTVDPDNQLYARQSVRRIESEAFRDAVLAVSGQAVHKMYGPPIPVMEDGVGQIVLGKENLDGERKPRADSGLGADEHRRSLYVQVRRSRPLAVLESFDLPTNAPNCTKRSFSNVAPQSLFLMNSKFMVKYATAFADRVEREAGPKLEQQLRYAWKLAYSEQPADATIQAMMAFAQSRKTSDGVAKPSKAKKNGVSPQKQTLRILCQGLLAANQFIYVD